MGYICLNVIYMYLKPKEERMFSGEYGIAVQKSMEILVALGDIYNAEKLVDITSAQISGVSYKTIGDAGLEFLKDIGKDATVMVQSTLNPAGIDLSRKDLGFSEEFIERQLEIIEAYRSMNITTTCSCTPYLVGNVPVKGDHVAWSESSAVAYVNSIIGAKSNREGGPGALSAAICGKTPKYGYHLDEERKADLIVELEIELELIIVLLDI